MAILCWLLIAALPWLGQYTPIDVYSSDPDVRMEQLLQQSEDFRTIKELWPTFSVKDQPVHLTPYRVHGGVGP